MKGGRGADDQPVIYEGDWDAALTYHPRRIVKHGGAAYLSLGRSVGVEPGTDDTKWFPLGGGGSGGPVLYVSSLAAGPPTDGSVFWWVTDDSC